MSQPAQSNSSADARLGLGCCKNCWGSTPVGPAFRDPGDKAVPEQARIDAVHDAAQPIDTGNAEVEFGKALIAIAAASAF